MLPYATMFDRQCRVLWVSRLMPEMTAEMVILHHAWEWAGSDIERESLRTHFARCLIFGEEQRFETVGHFHHKAVRFSVWLYPVQLEEVGAMSISAELSSSAALLTEREKQVLQSLASGLGTKQIARRLGIARSTVETHIAHCKSKLQLHNKESLIAFAAKSFRAW